MEYLQYIIWDKESIGRAYVLNLIINGIPSILQGLDRQVSSEIAKF